MLILFTILLAFGVFAAFLIWAYSNSYFSPTAVLGAAYLILVPVAVVAGLGDVEAGYVEVVFLLLMAGRCIMLAGERLVKGCCGAMLLFYVLLLLGVIYCDDPMTALKYKTFGLTTFLAGMGISLTVSDIAQLRRDLRLLFIACVVVALILFSRLFTTWGETRFSGFEMNPNTVGNIAAASFCLTIYIAFWETHFFTRIVSIISSGALGLTLVPSGSRTAFGASIIILLLNIFSHMKRLRHLLVATVVLGITSWVFFISMAKVPDLIRVMNTKIETGRLAMWEGIIAHNPSPLFGIGTYLQKSVGGRIVWGNTHSIYIQIYYEAGVLGLLVFSGVMCFVLWHSIRVYRTVILPEKWLAFAMLILPLSVGLFESAPIFGMCMPSLWWGMGLGLIDRLPSFNSTAENMRSLG